MTAHELYRPALIAITPLERPLTATGTELFVVLPFPRLPELPQHLTDPSRIRAHEW
jgi:hypothetical protein